MDFDVDKIIWIVAAAAWLIGKVAKLLRRGQAEPSPTPAPSSDDQPYDFGRDADGADGADGADDASDYDDGPAEVPQSAPALVAEAQSLVARASNLATSIRRERATRRFVPVLTEWLPAQARGALDYERVASMRLVVEEVEELVRQRRDPELLPELGDADALAEACYRPVIEFARAEGLPLSSAEPVSQLSGFDLAIWTGFAPTSLAPLFLPPDFFQRAAWWPAIGHEIGHDFLVSLRGIDGALRAELRLPSEESGTRPIAFDGGGLSPWELRRVFGGWFEELFCDVFGTLMCGGAYVATMSQLFAARSDAREVLVVGVDETGRRYDPHPPRHLRHRVGCMVLDAAGFGAEARALDGAWAKRHTADGRVPDRYLFPVAQGYLAVPAESVEEIARELVERLYLGPITALSGFGLRDVSGLDYGPHLHEETVRARDALLAGRALNVRDPRAIVAGAVHAALLRPEAEPMILARARAAIPGVGTRERVADAYAPDVAVLMRAPTPVNVNVVVGGASLPRMPGPRMPGPRSAAGRSAAGRIAITQEELVDAMVLRELLARPRPSWPC